MAAADLTGNGKTDIVYVDGASSATPALHVLMGNGNGTFSHGQDINLAAGVCCTSLTLADVTGDGHPDVILVGANLAVLPGIGDGTFQSPIVTTLSTNQFFPGGGNGSIGVGDINRDGKTDLAVPYTSGILILFGDDTGHFTLANTVLVDNSAFAITLAGLRGNGILDIVFPDFLGADVQVLLGNGDGTFQANVLYTGAADAVLADIEGNGHPDLVVQSFPAQNGQIGLFKNNGDGTFAPFTPLTTVSSINNLLAVKDFTGAGKLDLVFNDPAGIALKMATGDLTYGPLQKTAGGTTRSNFPAATVYVYSNFTSSGFLDVAMPTEGGICILFGNGDGTFKSADLYDLGQAVGAAAVGNFIAGKPPEIAVALANSNPQLLIGDGKGAFTLGPLPNISSEIPTPSPFITGADFTGSGIADLLMGSVTPGGPVGFGADVVIYGNGEGTFSGPLSSTNLGPVVGDFDNSGRAGTVTISNNSIVVSLGTSGKGFTTEITPLRNILPATIAVGDINHDGKTDLVIGYSDHLEIWFGDGDGTFQFHNNVSLSNIPIYGIAPIADLDGDGNLDLVLTANSLPEGPPSVLAILYGHGDGTFDAPIFLPTSEAYTQAVVADINGDNKPDLILTDGYGIAVMLNMGNRQFGPENHFTAGASVSWINVADVNGDGFPDIVATNPSGTTAVVLLNQPNGASLEGAAVNGTLSFSPEPSTYNQPFTMTLQLAPQKTGGPQPTGSVAFSLDGTFLATIPLTNGVASFIDSTAPLPVQHTVVAFYNGDSNYAPASFAAFHNIVPPQFATQTVLTANPANLVPSQTARLSAQVTATQPVPAGVVTFLDGGNTIGSALIGSGGVAFFDTALLGAGTHSLTAEFQGDSETGFGSQTVAAVFLPSTSAPATVTVTPNVTSTALAASATSITAGAVLTFTASVNSSAGGPFGGVSFFDGPALLGTTALNSSGQAQFSTASLATGTHSITADFNANGPYGASLSTAVNVSVTTPAANQGVTFISLAQEMNSVGGGVFTAHIEASQGSPAGLVTWMDNGAILGQSQTDAFGNATISLSTIGSGQHRLTTSFAGGADFAPGVSPVIQDQWPASGPGFSLNLSTQSLGLESGASKPLPITLAPIGKFAASIELSCAPDLPAPYVCDFSRPTVNGGGTAALVVRALGTQASTNPAHIAPFLIACAALLLFAASARRQQAFVAIVMLALFAASALTACNGSMNAATQKRTFVLTIRATSGSGEIRIIHSGQVILKIE